MAVYTVNQLITKAYYLAGITARGLETLEDYQINDGLERLNAFLAMRSADIGLIPYYQTYTFPAVIGQEKYAIRDLVAADVVTFTLDSNQSGAQNVRFSMTKVDRAPYLGVSRPIGIASIPNQWMINRTNTGSDLYFYFSPGQAMQFTVEGLFSLTSVALNQDLNAISIVSPDTTVTSAFYHEFMLYGLAELICEFNSLITPGAVSKRYKEYYNTIMGVSPMDWATRKTSFFSGRAGINYMYARDGSNGMVPY